MPQLELPSKDRAGSIVVSAYYNAGLCSKYQCNLLILAIRSPPMSNLHLFLPSFQLLDTNQCLSNHNSRQLLILDEHAHYPKPVHTHHATEKVLFIVLS